MKITKIGINLEEREKANEGCNVCPCCGCSKTYNYASGKYINCITKETKRVKSENPFKIMLIDCYECPVCGAKWESGLYSGGTYINNEEEYINDNL